MQKLRHKDGGIVGIGAPLPVLEVGALCTGLVGLGGPYICTGVMTGVRSLLTDAAAPSVQSVSGDCVKPLYPVALAATVWVCGGRLFEVSFTLS